MNQLKALRWGVRGVLMLGVAASVVANILHANPNPISQSIAAWPPLALLLTVELISRVPAHHQSLAIARMTAATCIAGIAAWVSYGHMVGVATRYGETGASPYLIPVSVDGLIVVASICLVEIGGRISVSGQPAHEEPATPPAAPSFDYPQPIGPMPAPAPKVRFDHERPIGPEPLREPIMIRFDHDRPIGPEPLTVVPEVARFDYPRPVGPEPLPAHFDYEQPAGPEPAPVARPRRRAPRALTAAERVIAAHQRAPKATHEQIADRAKVSVSTVKRYRPTGSPSAPEAARTIKASGSPEPVRENDLVGTAA